MAYISPNDIKADKTYKINGVTWNEYLLKNHNINKIALPTKRTQSLLGLTIHCTDDLRNVHDDGRQYTAATVSGNMGQTRTTLYIDDVSAWQNLELDDMNWTCGDGVAGWGNSRTISLEVIMNGTTGAENIKAKDNAARIAAYLLHKYNMTANNLYTHNYWINKRNGNLGSYEYMCTTQTPTRHCPYYILTDGKDGWTKFRKLVDSYIVQLGGKSVFNNTPSPTPSVSVKTTPVKYIMKSLGTAAIRKEPRKTGTLIKRVVKGKYYPVDVTVVNENKETWLKHTGTNTYSANKDGGYLFTRVDTYTIKTTTHDLNVRSNPTTSASKITMLPKGTKVYVFDNYMAKANGFTWVKILIGNDIGYVASKYLK